MISGHGAIMANSYSRTTPPCFHGAGHHVLKLLPSLSLSIQIPSMCIRFWDWLIYFAPVFCVTFHFNLKCYLPLMLPIHQGTNSLGTSYNLLAILQSCSDVLPTAVATLLLPIASRSHFRYSPSTDTGLSLLLLSSVKETIPTFCLPFLLVTEM